MECISGGELSEYITKYVLDEKEIAKIMKQAFEAIEYLHACGIMHRDLKPENILVQLENTVYSDETDVQNFKWKDLKVRAMEDNFDQKHFYQQL